jgi:hypothetical protein
MNRYPTPSRLQRATFIVIALATSLLTLGSVGSLAEHYAGAAPAAPQLALAAPPASVR